MSPTTDPRRERRRRLVMTWSRTAADEAPAPTPERRLVAEYGPEADPERQRGPATLLPTSLGRFALAAVGLPALVAAAAAVGAWEPLSGRPLLGGEGRFAATLGLLRDCFDPRSPLSLTGWLAQLSLVMAAGVALIVRQMRRQRRDDFKGRFRAWGWMAAVLAIASASGCMPLGRLCGAGLAEATGIVIGPGGIGWWHLLAAAAFAVIGPWAVLPLHERAATSAWLVAALAAWATAAGCDWLDAGRVETAVVGLAAWAVGCSLVAVAMLAAARSVIREVRGLCRPADRGPRARDQVAAGAVSRPAIGIGDAAEERRADRGRDGRRATTDEEEPDRSGEPETAFIDGSEQLERHLSKAERKRLRKLARMQQAA